MPRSCDVVSAAIPRTAEPGATRRLAGFVAELRYEDLPPAVVDRARACLLDSLGCCLFGNTLDTARRLMDLVRELGSAPQAGILGTRHRVSVADATLVNAGAAHAFEFDEVHNRGSLHAASLVVPAVLALADGTVRASGHELITALVAGSEAGLRIGCAAAGSLFQRGFHAHAVCGTYAAGIAAAKLLRLDARRIGHAMGHCGSQSAGLNAAQEGGDAKSLQSGRAAQSGVYAALLARLGSTGIEDVLETPHGGFFATLAGQWDADAVTSGLGERWEMLDIGFKAYPVNGAVGSAIETLDRIMREHALNANDIEEVVAGCSTRTVHHCGARYEPRGRHAAQMSMGYGLALMVVRRVVTAREFLGERFDEPEVVRFAGRIRVEVEPRFDAAAGQYRLASRLAVRTRAGRVHEDETLVRLGDPRRPMQPEALRRKFRDLAAFALPASGVEKIIECVDVIEGLGDCTALTGLLAAPLGETTRSASTDRAPA